MPQSGYPKSARDANYIGWILKRTRVMVCMPRDTLSRLIDGNISSRLPPDLHSRSEADFYYSELAGQLERNVPGLFTREYIFYFDWNLGEFKASE